LRERYPDQPLDLDDNISLDLNLDSFDWMEIAVALDERMGIYLSETDIAGIQTIRDLLRLAIERRDEAGALPRERTMATDFARWLAPTGMVATAFGMALYALNRLVMRGLFRLRPNFFVSKAGTRAIEVRVRNLPEDSIAAQSGWVVYGF